MKKKKNTIQVFKRKLTKIKSLSGISSDPILSQAFDEKKLSITSLLTKCSKLPDCKKSIIKDLVKFQSLVNKQIEVINSKDTDPILKRNLQKEIISLLDSLIYSIKSRL